MDKNRETYTPRKREIISRSDRLRSTGKKESKSSDPDQQSWEPKKSNSTKWVFRLLIVPMLCIFVAFGGMVAGFVILGKGSVSEALQMDTWTHMFKLIFG